MNSEFATQGQLPKIPLELFIPNLPVNIKSRLEEMGRFDNEKFPMDGDWGRLEIPSILPFDILSKLAPQTSEVAKYVQPVIQITGEITDHVHSVFIHQIKDGIIEIQIRDLETKDNYIQILEVSQQNGNTTAISETNLVKYDAFEFGELIPTRIMGIYKALEYLGFVLAGKINQQTNSRKLTIKEIKNETPSCMINKNGIWRKSSNGLTKSEIQAFDEIIWLASQNIKGQLFRR